jgi:two-component system invasion response regulator UvrY
LIRTVIADDHTIVRRGLKEILESESDITVVFEAANGDEAVEYVSANGVDVVVMDITMPPRNGLEALKDIKKLKPALPVIVLSMHTREQYAVRVLKAGAAGYITKESAPDELVTAIRKAYRGGKYISNEVAELLAVHVGGSGSEEPHKILSDRELEVFLSIGRGRSLTEIANDLNISVKTVSTYRTRIIEKTSLTTNAMITRYCVEHSLN